MIVLGFTVDCSVLGAGKFVFNFEKKILMASLSFVKADSRNIPAVSNAMIIEYMMVSTHHNIAEIRGAKALMSSRDAYLDSAVGYVEINRSNDICTVRAKVVPEHRVTSKSYVVTSKIKESDSTILDTICADCAASAGGCKHTLLLLFWLEKRSSEPSTTSTQCFWVKPTLSSVRSEHILVEDIYKNSKKIKLAPRNPAVLQDFYLECEQRGTSDSLVCNLNEKLNDYSFNLFDMAVDFFLSNSSDSDFTIFKNYLDRKITKNVIEDIKSKTIEQSNSKFWHYIRQGRLTASKIHEAANCETDGALVQQILGGYKVPQTLAIQRGNKLEQQVLKELEKKLHISIDKCGFILIDSIVGASPDGVTNDYVIEVKCPVSKKTFKTYVKNNEIAAKYRAQINLQMLATGLKKGIFCVADPTFENTKIIHIHEVQLDELYINQLVKKALRFWKIYIYPKILKSSTK